MYNNIASTSYVITMNPWIICYLWKSFVIKNTTSSISFMISYIFLGYIFFLSIITPNKQHIIYNQSALNTWLEKSISCDFRIRCGLCPPKHGLCVMLMIFPGHILFTRVYVLITQLISRILIPIEHIILMKGFYCDACNYTFPFLFFFSLFWRGGGGGG